MFDPFNSWSRLMSAGFTMTETSLRVAETRGAAGSVVSSRRTIIGSALRSPLKADHTELARMVPEKVDVFTRSGSAIIAAWWFWQAAWLNEMQNLGAMATRGRVPTGRRPAGGKGSRAHSSEGDCQRATAQALHHTQAREKMGPTVGAQSY